MASPHQGAASGPNPAALVQLHFAFAPSLALAAGVQLEVFTHISAGRQTAAEIAREAQASERGTRMLLDTLAAFELLRKQDGRYELTPTAAAFLVKGKPDYAGALLESGDQVMRPWLELADSIRTGRPVHRVEEQSLAEEFFPPIVRALHVINREPARRLAEALGAGTKRKGMHVVDVACGSGVWGIAIAEADPEARITAQDFPRMLEVTREFLGRHNVAKQYEFLPGDLKRVEFGESRYDAAVLGNIVHSEGEESSRDLFRRIARALKPGGRIAILDMIPTDDRTGPPFPVLFALNMLVHTGEGDTYTFPEYSGWLAEAGFANAEAVDVGSHSPAIVATRR